MEEQVYSLLGDGYGEGGQGEELLLSVGSMDCLEDELSMMHNWWGLDKMDDGADLAVGDDASLAPVQANNSIAVANPGTRPRKSVPPSQCTSANTFPPLGSAPDDNTPLSVPTEHGLTLDIPDGLRVDRFGYNSPPPLFLSPTKKLPIAMGVVLMQH